MRTQDILLDLCVVLRPGCNSGLLWHVPHRLAARRRSRQERRLTLFLQLVHEGGVERLPRRERCD
jgi:hypothetical protein